MIRKNHYISQNSAFHLDVFTIVENDCRLNFVEGGSMIEHRHRDYIKATGREKEPAHMSNDIKRRLFEMLTTYQETTNDE